MWSLPPYSSSHSVIRVYAYTLTEGKPHPQVGQQQLRLNYNRRTYITTQGTFLGHTAQVTRETVPLRPTTQLLLKATILRQSRST